MHGEHVAAIAAQVGLQQDSNFLECRDWVTTASVVMHACISYTSMAEVAEYHLHTTAQLDKGLLMDTHTHAICRTQFACAAGKD